MFIAACFSYRFGHRWFIECECICLEGPGNYYLLNRIIINIVYIEPWKSQHFFLSYVAFTLHQKNLYRMLVMCLKVYKNVISREDGMKRHFSSVIFVEELLDGRLV